MSSFVLLLTRNIAVIAIVVDVTLGPRHAGMQTTHDAISRSSTLKLL